MHILLLNDDVLPSARGGSAVVVEWLRRGLQQRGHEVSLITTHQDASLGSEIDMSDAYGWIRSIHVDYSLRERHWKCLGIPHVSKRLEELMAERKADVVHAHTIHTYLTYDALRIAKDYTNHVFLTSHDTYAVSFGRVRGPRYESNALAHTPHTLSIVDHLREAGRTYNPGRNRAIRRILQSSGTQVIAVSNAVQSLLTANGIDHVVTIHNAVPAQAHPEQKAIDAFRTAHQLTGPTILYGGRVSEDKGIASLLQALPVVIAAVPQAQLCIAGEQERALPYISALPLEIQKHVTVTGWLPLGDMPTAYAAATVVTTPSVYLDAFNLMNIEAMMVGTPVVGTVFGGTAEIVEDGKTGYLVNPKDTEAYAKKLIHLLTDNVLRTAMSAAAVAHVREQFSLDAHVEKHLQLYST